MLVCVFVAFSLCRESPHLLLGDKPLISEVVLSQVVPQVEVGVNSHEGLAQGQKGHDMQDPRGGQIVQLQGIIL
jgi:hypothetical protein